MARSDRKDIRRPEDWFPPARTINTPSTGEVDTAITDALAAVDINTTAPLTGGGNLSADRTLVLSGTKAEFDAALTDGNFLYVGDVSAFTSEDAQDAVGGILTDTSTINFTYNDGANTIEANVIAGSIGSTELAATTVVAGSYTSADITVDADGRITAAANGAGGGSYTDEQAQDAVGGILTDSAHIDFTYNDGAPSITASIIAGSIGATELASTAVAAGSYTNTNLTVDADGRLTAASNGTPLYWSPATANGTGTHSGATRSQYTPTFAGGNNKALEVEAVFVKTLETADCVLGISNSGGKAVRLAYQGDGNKLFYSYNGATETAVGATGSTDKRTGLCTLKLRLSVKDNTGIKVDGMIDDQRLPTANSTGIGIDMVNTLTIFTNDNDANVAVVDIRYRWST